MRINGTALRAIRERTGMSAAALAEAISVHASVITRLEQGERRGTPEQITALARALAVPTTAIIAHPEEAA